MTASTQIARALAQRHASTEKVLNETRPLAEIRADLARKAADQEHDPEVRFDARNHAVHDTDELVREAEV